MKHIKNLLLLIPLICIALPLTGSFSYSHVAEDESPTIEWSKTYGGSMDDIGRSVQATSDGGYIIAGSTSSFSAGKSDVYLVKTDSEGNMLWNRTYGGPNADEGNSVQETSDGGYIIAGDTYSFGAGGEDIYLVKTDSEGNMLWNKTYGGLIADSGHSVLETSDGGYIIAGSTKSFGAGDFGAGDSSFFLVKTDSEGNVLWNKAYGGLYKAYGKAVLEASDGGYVIAGESSYFEAKPDVYLFKTDSEGNMLWSNHYGGAAKWWYGYSVQATSDGGYIITGRVLSFPQPGFDPPVLTDVYLIKTDSHGKMLWSKTYGGLGWEDCSSVQETGDGGYVIAGSTSSFGAGGDDVYLVKTDSEGNMLWNKTYGGLGGDWGKSVQETSDGGYIIAGGTSSFGAGESDVYLVKTDSEGKMLWNRTYGGTANDVGCYVQATSDRGYIIAGYTYSTFFKFDADIYLVKTDSEGNLLWNKTHSYLDWDEAHSVQETSDGGYIIVGRSTYYAPSERGVGPDVYLSKTDSDGKILWFRTYTHKDNCGGHSVQETSDGGYIIVGFKQPLRPVRENGYVHLFKTNSMGNRLWSKTYGGPKDDVGYSVQETGDGGYIIAGGTYSFGAGEHDVYLVKTDSEGKMLWNKTYGGPENDVGYSVQETGDGGYIIAGGTSSFGAGSEDVYLIKTKPMPIPISISCEVSAHRIGLGVELTVSGVTSPVMQDRDVNLTYTLPDGSTLTRTVKTDGNGAYHDAYSPEVTGSWGVKATWVGDPYFEASSSITASFEVKEEGPSPYMYGLLVAALVILALAVLILIKRR